MPDAEKSPRLAGLLIVQESATEAATLQHALLEAHQEVTRLQDEVRQLRQQAEKAAADAELLLQQQNSDLQRNVSEIQQLQHQVLHSSEASDFHLYGILFY